MRSTAMAVWVAPAVLVAPVETVVLVVPGVVAAVRPPAAPVVLWVRPLPVALVVWVVSAVPGMTPAA